MNLLTMLRIGPPRFWSAPRPGPAATLLRPVAAITALVARRRMRRKRYDAPIPVLCIGNVTVGGTGKTPLTLDFVRRLKERGHNPHVLLRGYGGRERGPLLVDPGRATARDVGDEALLLAQAAPTWIGADRAASARLAAADGADCLVMDDGFQNPALRKDVSVLAVDGATGFGNGLVLPAGPLREKLGCALARAQAVVVIGEDRRDVLSSLLPGLAPFLAPGLLKTSARLIPGPEIRGLSGRRVIAFAGIGRPEKFFDMLRDSGVDPIRCLPFPDHHPYSAADVRRLEALARESGTTLVTTAKDAVRLPAGFRVTVVTVEIRWADPTAPDAVLDRLFAAT